jgi:hypothetical protein
MFRGGDGSLHQSKAEQCNYTEANEENKGFLGCAPRSFARLDLAWQVKKFVQLPEAADSGRSGNTDGLLD